ncbi:MAG: UbiD family decarboxylase [Candidatus Micrarchaeota archaeon]
MFREFLKHLISEGEIVKITRQVSAKYEIPGIMKELDGRPVLFEKVDDYQMKVVGNTYSSRELVARYLKTEPANLLFKMADAIENPEKPDQTPEAPFNDNSAQDISQIPILTHCKGDGGPYISSGVVISKDKEFGGNLSFHRMMVIDETHMALRILPRHLNEFIKRNGGELDVAIAIGGSAPFMIAAATSVDVGFDEMSIANSLEAFTVSPSPTYNIPVPTEAEIIIEGRITKNTAPEGRFVDLTGTHDIIRQQPVMEIKRVSYRDDAYYQALLPGASEHKVLMGMPREPTIYQEVNKVCSCKNVYLTLGGGSWLHGVIQIEKEGETDGRKAIDAAFKGHKSMKRVVVVDKDIDLLDPFDVEWAIATRVQADRDIVVKPNEKGSSLDPSADPSTRKTTKWGIDATKPLGEKAKDFEKVQFPKVRIEDYTNRGV